MIFVAGRDFTAESLLSFGNGKNFQGHPIWKMANSMTTSLKKALSLAPQLSPKLVMIDTTCRVAGYASRKNEALFMQAIDHGMYVLDKKDKKGFLSVDDDEQLGAMKRISNVESGDGDDDVDDSCNGDESVVVVLDSGSNDKPVDSWVLDNDLNDKPVDSRVSSNSDLAPYSYSFIGKLAFICFGPTSKFYSPILSTGGSMNQSKEEKMKGGRASIRKLQDEKAMNERVTSNGKGITQLNCMQFEIMAQNKDSAAQAHRDMRLVTIMKRAELTQKMIEMKMSMWEKMGDGDAKDKIYESIQDLFDKSEDLQTQLQDIGLEEQVFNPIVLSVLSNVATSMGLSNGKLSGEDESDYTN